MILHAHALVAAWLLAAAAGSNTGIPSRAHLVEALTRENISIEFDRSPARKVFEHLQQALGISIVGRYSDDRAGHEVDGAAILLEALRCPAEHVSQLVFLETMAF